MDLDWLKDFIALAEHGNFSRAAEARHITQPAFSRRVRALEDWIGTPLFVRSAQGATLTTAGTAFWPLALDLARDLDRARREALSAAEHETSSLAIAATHALSFTFFPSWISRLVEQESVGTINLVSDTMEAVEQALLAGEVHFLLCHYRAGMTLRLDADRFANVRVGGDTLIAVAAADETGQPLWRVPGSAGRATPVLGYSPASGLGRILAAAGLPAGRDGLETVFTSHLAATLRAMAREGRGVAWLPRSLVETDLADRTLVRAGTAAHDVEIDVRLFRSPDCRNLVADRAWARISSESNEVRDR